MNILNIGCGKNILTALEGDTIWNLDTVDGPGIDIVHHLGQGNSIPLPENSIDLVLGSHVWEHLYSPLRVAEELYKVCAPGARMILRTPYGSSDDAWEDPTHYRPIFRNTFMYLSQAAYRRADYNYRADWQVKQRVFILSDDMKAYPQNALDLMIRRAFNVVAEFQVTLECVKPGRFGLEDIVDPPGSDLITFAKEFMEALS